MSLWTSSAVEIVDHADPPPPGQLQKHRGRKLNPKALLLAPYLHLIVQHIFHSPQSIPSGPPLSELNISCIKSYNNHHEEGWMLKNSESIKTPPGNQNLLLSCKTLWDELVSPDNIAPELYCEVWYSGPRVSTKAPIPSPHEVYQCWKNRSNEWSYSTLDAGSFR